MKYEVKYMLSRSARKPHTKTYIQTQHGTLEFESETDPIGDPEAAKLLREKLNELNPGWSIAGYHVSEGKL